MTRHSRIRSALALAVFATVAIGGPVADAVVYHADAEHASRPHVESADGPACHAERCTLGAPLAPTPPAIQLSAMPRFDLHELRSLRIPAADAVTDRTPLHAPGSRAPPA
jgi:hypothetical protein